MTELTKAEQTLLEQELRKQLDEILDAAVDDFYRETYPISSIRDKILALIKEAGYVQLAEAQLDKCQQHLGFFEVKEVKDDMSRM